MEISALTPTPGFDKVDNESAELLAENSIAAVESIQKTFDEATINSTDSEVIAAKNVFLAFCGQVKEAFKPSEVNKPGFGTRAYAVLAYCCVAAANAMAKVFGKPDVFSRDLAEVKKKSDDLSRACEEYEAHIAKQSNEAQKRHGAFGHFVEFVEKIPPEVMAEMKPEDRLNFLMEAATISPDDIGPWLRDMPIETYDRIIGPDLRSYFSQDSNGEMDFPPEAVKSLKDALDGSKVALLEQREPVSIERLDLTSSVVPGSTTTRGAFVRDLARSLYHSSYPGYEEFKEGTLSGKYKLQDQNETMSVQEAVALGIIPQRHNYEPGARIRPLIFDFYGVTPGKGMIRKGIDAARNVFGGTSSALECADRVVNETVKAMESKAEGNEVIVPYFVGHSFGGMLAQAMAIKNNSGSLTFNPLGIGSGTVEYVGKDRVIDAHASHRHMAFCSENDWLNGPMRRNVIGNQYLMPHNDPHGSGGPFNKKNRRIHNEYYNHFSGCFIGQVLSNANAVVANIMANLSFEATSPREMPTTHSSTDVI
ncbi:MAG: hypothetical protein LBF49_01825 [Puniceicoccales bacterium]|jgi:hypothetical protein|nr:hypothetical protein [Puniceicoccales bacterium]